MKNRFLFILFAAAALMMWSCSDDTTDGEQIWSAASVETLAPVSVSLENAVLQGRLRQNSETVACRGFLVSNSAIDQESAASGNFDPDEVTRIDVEGVEDGLFDCTLKDLEIGTPCHYMAFVELSDGTWRIGEERNFLPDYLDVESAMPPVASVAVENYKEATVTLKLGNFGTDNLMGLESQMFKIYDLGVYYWKDGEGSLETATKTSYDATEEQKQALTEGESISVSVLGLRGATTYNYVPYVQIGIYRPYADYVYLMPEAIGNKDSFTTAPTPPAMVSSLEATSVTTRTGKLNGKIDSDAGDENARFGFCFSTSESDLEEHVYEVTECDEAGLFVYALEGLDFNTTYYYKSWVSVREGEPDAETAYGATMSFSTMDLSIPAVEFTSLKYDYRVANVTPTSALVTCVLTAGIDTSLNLASCKVYWGTAPDALTNVAVTSDTELVDDNSFTVLLTGLTPGTVYWVRPEATNDKGTSVYDKEASFRTPVTGREYLFDVNISDPYFVNRTSTTLEDCTDLVYHELDPIEGTSGIYYLLDRNLNSRAPYTQAEAEDSLDPKNNTLDKTYLWQKAGGLYQWGYITPSYTWNMPAWTQLSPLGWTTATGINKTGSAWSENPCPAGYDIPTKAQWKDMIERVTGKILVENTAPTTIIESEITLTDVWSAMRMGPTSAQMGTNGNTGGTDGGPMAAFMHTKDGCVNDTAKVGLLQIGQGETGNAKSRTVLGFHPREHSKAIRCVRVEAK